MIIEILSYTGLILILLPFILDELGKITNKSITYNLMNLIGASILAWYAFQTKTYIFTISNSVWAIFALYTLIKIIKKHK